MVLPKSIDKIPEEFLEDMYQRITDKEIQAPLHRSFFQEKISEATFIELSSRVAHELKKDGELTLQEFINCADLT